MKTYNIIEYKSPDDGLSIDDFYKTLGYAFLYKGYGETVNQIPVEELTVSVFRNAYPRELIAELKREGSSIEEKYPGIYYVTGKIQIPAQIVVTSELKKESHSSLRVLSNKVEKDDVERFLNEARKKKAPGERNDIDAILQASMSANQELYKEVRKDANMCKAMEELMADVIEAREDNKSLEYIRKVMNNLKYTAEQAMDFLEIPQEKRASLIKKL